MSGEITVYIVILCVSQHNRRHYLVRILSAAEKCKQYSSTVLEGVVTLNRLLSNSPYRRSQLDKITKGTSLASD